ncbi:zinc alcohol dehydrogenase like protein [Zymoseptoria brevis]|uniref:Zinc alcohol dehydrogenase like protein n=1 Tax=Zymoseptoria brevis TaxID=1047168 RepID=A0A0F4G4V1_9PEZI|nr:zinc alcohol dehydrogenase like protein [Zymoseptoria brevis]
MRAISWTAPLTALNSIIETTIEYTASAPLPPSSESLPPDSALIKVAYASINPVHYKLPELILYRNFNYSLTKRSSTPLIPAGEYSGTVIESKFLVLPPATKSSDAVIRQGVQMRDACTIGVAGLTALQCLETMSGKRVLINGASGGTGTFGVQIAKALGWEDVVGTCSTRNVEFVKGLGADGVVDYRTEDVVTELKRRGREYGEFDLLIDNVDSPWLGGITAAASFSRRRSDGDGFARIADWIAEGNVKPVIAREYKLEEAREAFLELKSGRVRGKLVIKVSGEENNIEGD